jgi:hypothetical protein
MVWMGRAARYASWKEVEANGVSYEELASRDLTAAIMDNINEEAAEEGAPTDGAGPSQVALREEGPPQEVGIAKPRVHLPELDLSEAGDT